MGFYITKTTKKDIDRVMIILGEARRSIGKLGIDQWQYGYPSRDIIKDDVDRGFSYVVKENEDGEIVATFCLKEDEEPTYVNIYEGDWLSTADSFALHRIAICDTQRGKGVAGAIIEFIIEKCRENGIASLKVDTHEGNIPMRKMLEKNGFVYCGIIYLGTGEKRVAYEKTV